MPIGTPLERCVVDAKSGTVTWQECAFVRRHDNVVFVSGLPLHECVGNAEEFYTPPKFPRGAEYSEGNLPEMRDCVQYRFPDLSGELVWWEGSVVRRFLFTPASCDAARGVRPTWKFSVRVPGIHSEIVPLADVRPVLPIALRERAFPDALNKPTAWMRGHDAIVVAALVGLCS